MLFFLLPTMSASYCTATKAEATAVSSIFDLLLKGGLILNALTTSSMAALAETQTVFSHGMSLFPSHTFSGQLNADQCRSCLQPDHPVRIDGRQAWDVSGILQQRRISMFPFIQSHPAVEQPRSYGQKANCGKPRTEVSPSEPSQLRKGL